jgi:hypothetical protein
MGLPASTCKRTQSLSIGLHVSFAHQPQQRFIDRDAADPTASQWSVFFEAGEALIAS